MKKFLSLFVLLLCLVTVSVNAQNTIKGVYTAVLSGATHPPVEKSLDLLNNSTLPGTSGFLYVVLDQPPTGCHYEWDVFASDNSNVRLNGPVNSYRTCVELSGTETDVTLRIFLENSSNQILANRDFRFYVRNIPSQLNISF